MKVSITGVDLSSSTEIPMISEGKIKARFQDLVRSINDVVKAYKKAVIILPEEAVLLMTAMEWQRMGSNKILEGALGCFMDNDNHLIIRQYKEDGLAPETEDTVVVSEVSEQGLFVVGQKIFCVGLDE